MKQQKQHCPEVERLMGGRLPFVTRYGITIVVIVMALVCAGLAWSGGPSATYGAGCFVLLRKSHN